MGTDTTKGELLSILRAVRRADSRTVAWISRGQTLSCLQRWLEVLLGMWFQGNKGVQEG